MKKIIIKIIIDEVEGKIAILRNMVGFNKNDISSQFELIGILQNLVDNQKEKVKTLISKNVTKI